MALNDYPTLSPAGFLTTPAEKADACLAHAQASDKSQTKLFGDNVASLAWLFEQHSSDVGMLCKAIKNDYERLFSRYFEDVDVDVNIDPASDFANNKITLRMYIQFSQDGRSYTVGNLLHGLNGRYSETVRIKEHGITS